MAGRRETHANEKLPDLYSQRNEALPDDYSQRGPANFPFHNRPGSQLRKVLRPPVKAIQGWPRMSFLGVLKELPQETVDNDLFKLNMFKECVIQCLHKERTNMW